MGKSLMKVQKAATESGVLRRNRRHLRPILSDPATPAEDGLQQAEPEREPHLSPSPEGPAPDPPGTPVRTTFRDPPENILYPAEEVLLGIENRLVCFVNRFYPPVISVTWTKNNCPVSKGVTTSAYIPNKDTTFHCFSTLTFTPEQGDVYSCTVQHPALEEPTTRIWDVDVERHQDLAVDLYCGLGLTVAFVGVAIGTYLTIKKRYCH
uniref:Ig-like domain-containing protein n=1 Tax=Knipowitschia caucasica TaxID=637954 RepID=A0AAV2MCZ2_KNICA